LNAQQINSFFYPEKLADSANSKAGALNKLCKGLTGNRVEIPYLLYASPLAVMQKLNSDQNNS